MSAFILLQNQQQQARIGRKVVRKKVAVKREPSSASNYSSSKSTLSSDLSTASSKSSRTSSILNRYASDTDGKAGICSMPFNTNTMIVDPDENYSPYHKREKKMFSEHSMQYQLKPIKLTPLETRIAEYEREIEGLRQYVEHRTNIKLNKAHSSTGDWLFSVRNLEILRYTYFKEITKDYNLIHYRQGSYKKNGTRSLRYMRKIDKIAAKQNGPKNVIGLPSLCEDDSTEDGDVESDNDSDLEDWRVKRDSMHETISVRELLKSTLFWNDVYQDFKYPREGINYHELLPSITQMRRFFAEILDHILYNIGQKCAATKDLVSSCDLQLIQTYVFTYFTDQSYNYFNLMSSVYQNMFSGSSSLASTPAGMEKISNELVNTILANLRGCTQCHNYSGKEYDAVFTLWGELLRYLIFVILEPSEKVAPPMSASYGTSILSSNSSALPSASSSILQNSFGSSETDSIKERRTQPDKDAFRDRATSFRSESSSFSFRKQDSRSEISLGSPARKDSLNSNWRQESLLSKQDGHSLKDICNSMRSSEAPSFKDRSDSCFSKPDRLSELSSIKSPDSMSFFKQPSLTDSMSFFKQHVSTDNLTYYKSLDRSPARDIPSPLTPPSALTDLDASFSAMDVKSPCSMHTFEKPERKRKGLFKFRK